jgi:hypothetical protein
VNPAYITLVSSAGQSKSFSDIMGFQGWQLALRSLQVRSSFQFVGNLFCG